MVFKHAKTSALHSLPGTSPSARVRAHVLAHLATGCQSCWHKVDQIVRCYPPPATPEPDPLWLALWRRGPADPLRPAHRLALLEARTGRLGFARLVLEETRELALAEPRSAHVRLRETQQLLAAARLETIDPERAHDLEALAWIYLADAKRVLGWHLEAEAGFAAARRALSRGSGWVEVAATLAELRAQLLWRQGKARDALDLLTQAQRQLQTPGLEGRCAEVLGRQAALLLRLGRDAEGLETLQRALAMLPAGQSLGLRLFLLHNLTGAATRLGLVEVAWAHLTEAEPLYEPHGHALLRVQRFWVRGRVEQLSGQPEAADDSLRAAVHGLLELGLARSAVWALFDLAELYHRAGWEERLEGLARLFDELSEKPAFLGVLRAYLADLVARARHRGVAVPELEALLERLREAEEKVPVA